MHLYLHLFGLTIPAYGFFIAIGVIIANLVAVAVIKRTETDFNDFIILEAYCFLGAFIGAKVLYLAVSLNDIDWERITEIKYFNTLMQSGFVFYGGLIGGILATVLAGRIHSIDSKIYVRTFIFLIPMIHSFGRIGCFMAGCCYGKPYQGRFSVIFPEGSFAPSGIRLFPVQLLEAVILMVISLVVLTVLIKKYSFTVEVYLLLYGISRFLLEYLRADENRGIFAGLSTSQWISMVLVGISVVLLVHHKKQLFAAKAKGS